MYQRNCIAPNCKIRNYALTEEQLKLTKNNFIINFYRFPENEDQRSVWIEAANFKNWKPSKDNYLCSLHFRDDCIDQKNNLFDHAVPTIFFNDFHSHVNMIIDKFLHSKIHETDRSSDDESMEEENLASVNTKKEICKNNDDDDEIVECLLLESDDDFEEIECEEVAVEDNTSIENIKINSKKSPGKKLQSLSSNVVSGNSNNLSPVSKKDNLRNEFPKLQDSQALKSNLKTETNSNVSVKSTRQNSLLSNIPKNCDKSVTTETAMKNEVIPVIDTQSIVKQKSPKNDRILKNEISTTNKMSLNTSSNSHNLRNNKEVSADTHNDSSSVEPSDKAKKLFSMIKSGSFNKFTVTQPAPKSLVIQLLNIVKLANDQSDMKGVPDTYIITTKQETDGPDAQSKITVMETAEIVSMITKIVQSIKNCVYNPVEGINIICGSPAIFLAKNIRVKSCDTNTNSVYVITSENLLPYLYQLNTNAQISKNSKFSGSQRYFTPAKSSNPQFQKNLHKFNESTASNDTNKLIKSVPTSNVEIPSTSKSAFTPVSNISKTILIKEHSPSLTTTQSSKPVQLKIATTPIQNKAILKVIQNKNTSTPISNTPVSIKIPTTAAGDALKSSTNLTPNILAKQQGLVNSNSTLQIRAALPPNNSFQKKNVFSTSVISKPSHLSLSTTTNPQKRKLDINFSSSSNNNNNNNNDDDDDIQIISPPNSKKKQVEENNQLIVTPKSTNSLPISPVDSQRESKCYDSELIESKQKEIEILEKNIIRKEKEISTLKKKIQVLKKRYITVKNPFDTKSDEQMIEDILSKYLEQDAVQFFIGQMKCSGKNYTQFRWSEEDKLFALSLLYKNPVEYNKLFKHFTLPSDKTLNKFVSKIKRAEMDDGK